jgi:hypothetical protein
MTLAVIVASARPRGGKTLLTRILAENFILGGTRPLIYDTNVADRQLARRYPHDVLSLDLNRVPDQMALFDALIADQPRPRIVDLANRSLQKFVDLSIESDFYSEARAAGIEPVFFFLPSPDPDAFEQACELQQRLTMSQFVIVENEYLGDIRFGIRQSDEYRRLAQNGLRVVMPALDRALMDVVEEWDIGLSDFMRDPSLKIALETRDEIRSWLVKILTDIYRVLDAVRRSANVGSSSE